MAGVGLCVTSSVRLNDRILSVPVEPIGHCSSNDRSSVGGQTGIDGPIKGCDNGFVESCCDGNAHVTNIPCCVRIVYTSMGMWTSAHVAAAAAIPPVSRCLSYIWTERFLLPILTVSSSPMPFACVSW